MDRCGRGNEAAIEQAALEADLIVCAWGSARAHRNRGEAVERLLHKLPVELHALAVSQNADEPEPLHPLYLPYSLKPRTLDALRAEMKIFLKDRAT